MKKILIIIQYLICSLYNETWDYIKSIPHAITKEKIKKLYQPKLWIYPFTILLIASIMRDDKISSIVCLAVIAFLGILRAEQTGNYIHWYRQKMKNNKEDNLFEEIEPTSPKQKENKSQNH